VPWPFKARYHQRPHSYQINLEIGGGASCRLWQSQVAVLRCITSVKVTNIGESEDREDAA
jgi:hypothetical protein